MKLIDHHIQYVEFKAHSIEKTKTFYSNCFDWEFTDYGANYVAFSNSGLEGGFEKTEAPITNGALVILYHRDLELVKNKIIASGGTITRDTFSFPGGKRFHFSDPNGNELAVWSDQ